MEAKYAEEISVLKKDYETRLFKLESTIDSLEKTCDNVRKENSALSTLLREVKTENSSLKNNYQQIMSRNDDLENEMKEIAKKSIVGREFGSQPTMDREFQSNLKRKYKLHLDCTSTEIAEADVYNVST